MSFRNPSHYSLSMLNSNQSNFNNAFVPNSTVIPQRDTKNYGNIIHNNVNDNILSEIVTEYTIHIDSKDRDTRIYPNPYSFIVSLGGPETRRDTNGNVIGNSGVPDPRIDVNFKNIKYVKIKYLMLPRNIFYDIVIDISGNKEYSVGTSRPTILANYRYLLLRVKEISNDKLYSTNDIIKNECFIIYRDSNYSDAINDLWFATQPVKIFYDNGLKNLTRLTIQILTPNGDELRLKSNNDELNNIPYNEINNDMSEDTPSSDFYFNFNEDIQTNMEFEIGVCENQINSQKKYR